MSEAKQLSGQSAIDYAVATGRLLSKHEDPTEGGREGLTTEEAQEVAKADPSLIWIKVQIVATSDDLAQWAQSAESSESVARAIYTLYPGRENEVWEAPTAEEETLVIELAWTLEDENEMHWGLETLRRPEGQMSEATRLRGQWAIERETSDEIARAIHELYPDAVQATWEDPTDSEKAFVLARAGEFAEDTGADALNWGEEIYERKPKAEILKSVAFDLLTYSEVEYLLCCAFEGGSNYWARKAAPYGVRSEWGHQAALYPTSGCKITDAETGEIYDLSHDSLEKGARLLKEAFPHHWADAKTGSEDATTGDVFLQLCVFGKLIFG